MELFRSSLGKTPMTKSRIGQADHPVMSILDLSEASGHEVPSFLSRHVLS